MRGLLSLDQELRAVRKAKGQNKANQSNHSPDPNPTERPWQADIDQVHQTMRELLRAIASLSGVELPGVPPGLQDDAAPPPRLDIKNLKDRFRSDLEGFSIKTTEEVTKRAKEKTNAALDAIQNELGGKIEQVAAELREKLQVPAHVEKLLERSIEETESRLGRALSQKIEQLFAEQKHLLQDRVQEALSLVQAQIGTVGEAEARLERTLSQKIEQLIQEKLQRTPIPAQVQVSTPEEVEGQLERSLSQKTEQLFAEQRQLIQARIQEALTPVHAQVNSIEETEARLERSLSQKVEQLFAKQEQLIHARLREALTPGPSQINTAEESEARLERSLSQRVDQLFAKQEQLIQAKLQGALMSVQVQVGTLEQTVQQMRELQTASVAQLPAELPIAVVEGTLGKNESCLNNEFDGGLDQAFSRIKSSLTNFMRTSKLQPAQNTVAGLKEQGKMMPFTDADNERRVQQALENLGRLGSKNPHPASKV